MLVFREEVDRNEVEHHIKRKERERGGGVRHECNVRVEEGDEERRRLDKCMMLKTGWRDEEEEGRENRSSKENR